MRNISHVNFNQQQEDKSTVVSRLKDMIERIESIPDEEWNQYGVVNVLFKRNDEVLVGYMNMGFADRATVISHLQVDLMDLVIKANYIDE